MSDRVLSDRRRGPDLGSRIESVQDALRLGRGRCDPALLAAGTALVANAAARRRFAADRTVAALAGGTGSGKSTLFNAIAGAELAPTGVRRPTTSQARAVVWPADPDEPATDVGALLDWLDVRDRHRTAGAHTDDGSNGLVLLDLPDFDSTEAAHRLEADRLTEVVDVLVWVLDPQKYADAAIHERYLRPLRTHGDVMVVVLNQIDRLDPAAVSSCVQHLRRLLAEDGLPDVPIIATSAARGDGLAELHRLLAERTRSRQAATRRLQADLDRVVAELAAVCTPSGAKGQRPRAAARGDEQLAAALGVAAGVRSIADAAGGSYRQRAIGQVGWPPTRWLARVRPNPLRRLHLPGPAGIGSGGTSGPIARPTTGVQQAQVSNALRELVGERTAGVPAPWRRSAAAVVEARQQSLPGELDTAVRSADLSQTDRPRWWSIVRSTHLVLFVVALVGAGWLAVLAALSYLRLPDPVPHIGEVPVPTVLLLGGLLVGLLLAVVCRPFVRIGARRRAARARRSLDAAVGGVAARCVLEPLAAELRSATEFCAAVEAARR